MPETPATIQNEPEPLYPHAYYLCQGPCREHYPATETVVVNNGVRELRSCYDCLPAVCELAAAFPELAETMDAVA